MPETPNPESRPAEAALNLRDLDIAETCAALAPLGADTATARRVFAMVHRQRGGAADLMAVKFLRAEVRQALAARAVWPALEVVETRRAHDGFVKYLFRLRDGHLVEAVRIPLPDPADARALKERRRAGEVSGLAPLPTAKYTVCLSSQAGCALACDFCETGRLGALRNLATWEILAQYRHIAAEAEHPIRGVVFMGMGEPFLNYENVLRAARVFCHPAGHAIAAEAITISTAGVVPMIDRYTDEGHKHRLVFSLAAANSGDRLRLMPIEKRWPLPRLMESIRRYAQATRKRVTLAYVACGGVNMSERHAREIVDLVGDLRARLNLINVTDPSGRYQPASEQEIRAFFDVLTGAGIPVVRRYSGGGEIAAACGNLSASRRGGELVTLKPPLS